MKNRIAVVTGASQGIGAAIALKFAENGIHTIMVGRSGETLSAVQRSSACLQKRSTIKTINLTDANDILRFAESVRSNHSELDILVNCAGIYVERDLRDVTVEDFNTVFTTNCQGALLLTQSLLPLLIQASGDIVFVNSSVVRSAKKGTSLYSASKLALLGIADALRQEVNENGVRVLSVFPGRTATPMQEAIHQTAQTVYDPDSLLQPSDVATAIVACVNLPSTAEVTDLHIRPRNKC